MQPLERLATRRRLEDTDFSDEFCRFLQTTIPAVDAAELLLALKSDPGRWWSVHDALVALGPATSLSVADAGRYLENFEARGLIAVGADGRTQYHPGSDQLAAYCEILEKAYRERPVTLIRVIYALRDSKIRSFSDAFRLRRK